MKKPKNFSRQDLPQILQFDYNIIRMVVYNVYDSHLDGFKNLNHAITPKTFSSGKRDNLYWISTPPHNVFIRLEFDWILRFS